MQPEFGALRNLAASGLARSLCVLSQPFLSRERDDGLRRAVVLSGPLRGVRLAVSQLERPSFFLGTYERCVVNAICSHIQPNMVAYDVGAHIGYLTLLMSRLAGRGGVVLSFEPDPRNLQALRANVEDEGRGNVKICPVAVDSASGVVTFATFSYSLVGRIADSTTPNDATLATVPSVTLDDLVYGHGEPPPELIKIDVEGTEADVIQGALRIIRESRPVIIVEARRATTFPQVSSTMVSFGYDESILHVNRWGILDVLYTP